MNFEQRRIEQPQEVIDDLLKLLAKQNAEIHGQVEYVQKIKKAFDKAAKLIDAVVTPLGLHEQTAFNIDYEEDADQ